MLASRLDARGPLFCLVTDRHRLDEAGPGSFEEWMAQVVLAVGAGLDLVHVRERDLAAGALARLVRACVAHAAGTATRIVVNDRVDVALAAGADGVHLRGDSMPASRVRAIAPTGFLVGRSVRTAEEAERVAGEVDYLVLGTVFPTPSKPGLETVVGVDGLRRTVRAVNVPVLGIGGITAERLPEIAASGAAGVAAIRLFQPGRVDQATWSARVAAWRHLFDRGRSEFLP